jgi:hypothetical protein
VVSLNKEAHMGFDVTAVQKALAGISYPASSEDLAETAVKNGAESDLVDALRGIDADRVDGPDQVMHELKGQLGK